MSFKKLNLDIKLLRAIDACGFTSPTVIQEQAIPVVITGRDVMASAQTGTGKTAAFVLPALQRLFEKPSVRGNGPRILILTPTRELATQVGENIRSFSRFCKVITGSVVGGMPYPPQMRLLKKPLDMLVATPGRLMDHMEQGRIDFSRLEMLVLDEADRMLDMGFIDDVKKIAAQTPENRQTLLFSATLEGSVLNVAKELLNRPEKIKLAANHERHESIKQSIYQTDNFDHKQRLLSEFISCDSLSQAVVFTATKRGADKLAKLLSKDGHKSAALHGDMGQGARKRTVDNMRRGKFKLLVATDVAARGLDIKGISHVINYDLPMVAEDYIHRIGRTGRAGATGKAISLVGPDDWGKLAGIERLIGRKLERSVVSGLEPSASEPRSGRGNKGHSGKKRRPKVAFKKSGKSFGISGKKRTANRGSSTSRNGGSQKQRLAS